MHPDHVSSDPRKAGELAAAPALRPEVHTPPLARRLAPFRDVCTRLEVRFAERDRRIAELAHLHDGESVNARRSWLRRLSRVL